MKNSLRIHKWTHNEFNIFILGVLTHPLCEFFRVWGVLTHPLVLFPRDAELIAGGYFFSPDSLTLALLPITR